MSRTQGLDIRRAIMPFFDFRSEMNEIELGSHLWIRRISQDQVKSLQRGFNIIDEFDMALITHDLETEILYEPVKVNDTNELFRTVVLGLRLFKSGNLHEKATFLEILSSNVYKQIRNLNSDFASHL